MPKKGFKQSLEHKKKLSLSHMGLQNHLGFNHSTETKNKISKSKTGKKLSEEHKEKLKVVAKRGDQSHRWVGDKIGYRGLHQWVYLVKGNPLVCNFCGSNSDIQWANLSGRYKRDSSDWISLCRSCHKIFDNGRAQL